MEIDDRRQEHSDVDVLVRLIQRGEFLASRLAANSPRWIGRIRRKYNSNGDFDLYPTLEQCATWKEDVDEYCKTRGLRALALDNPFLGPFINSIYNLGLYFGELQHLKNLHQSAWGLRVRWVLGGRFFARDLDIKDYYRRESAESNRVRNKLGKLIYYLTYDWSPSIDFVLIMTNNSTMESYSVLSLDWTWELSRADALEGANGDIYVRTDTYLTEQSPPLPVPIFVMYRQGYFSLTSKNAILPETTEESNEVDLQITQHEERLEDFLHTALGSSTTGNTTAPISAGAFAENKVPSADQHQHDYQAGTCTHHIQLPSTSHLEAVVVEPTEALQSSITTIDKYGFSQVIIPSAPLNTILQGILPYESRDWAAPVSLTSPEADSPWSETQGPPPPYALSPGIYQLRLEAATRPSPIASSPDPETPAPPYALSPGVFHRYGDDF